MTSVDDLIEEARKAGWAEAPTTGPAELDAMQGLCDALIVAMIHIDWQLARFGLVTVQVGHHDLYQVMQADLRASRRKLHTIAASIPYARKNFQLLIDGQASDAS